jgi:drug/metabolite transporter (DMT)-like permease
MASLLALLSSILWGGADFLGGKLSKRYQAIAVTAVSQAIGLAIGILIVLISSSWFRPTLSWDNYFLSGVCAGLLGFIGLVAFYSGLATGRMGVVAPISALSVIIPLTIAFINGEKPNTGQMIGMGIALTGAFFASGPEIKGGLAIKPIVYAVIAAFGFGGAVTFIAKGSESSAIMTMTTMRFATFMVALLLFARFRTIGGFTKKDLPILIAIGGATALLAFKLLHERLHKVQYLGIAFAITGVAVISLS